MLLRQAAKEFGWSLNYGGIALMWRGGCIIRSVFLGNIKAAYDKNPDLDNLLLDDFFRDALHKCQPSWRKVRKLVIQCKPHFCRVIFWTFFRNYLQLRVGETLSFSKNSLSFSKNSLSFSENSLSLFKRMEVLSKIP